MRTLAATTLVLVLCRSAPAQPARPIDVAAALEHVRILASPEMEGRKSGTPGAERAARYIAGQFRSAGLEPLGDFLQRYTFPSFQFTGPCGFWVLEGGGARPLRYGSEYYILNTSGPGEFEGGVVFVGYGIHAPERGYDDYAGMDVAGRVLLCLVGAPD